MGCYEVYLDMESTNFCCLRSMELTLLKKIIFFHPKFVPLIKKSDEGCPTH